MIQWSRTVGQSRRLSALQAGILIPPLHTPGVTTGSVREKLRHRDKRRVTARQDITATDTVTIILLLASDPWRDVHMQQVGWTLGQDNKGNYVLIVDINKIVSPCQVRVAPRYRDKSANLPNQLAEKCLTKSANQQLRENATL